CLVGALQRRTENLAALLLGAPFFLVEIRKNLLLERALGRLGLGLLGRLDGFGPLRPRNNDGPGHADGLRQHLRNFRRYRALGGRRLRFLRLWLLGDHRRRRLLGRSLAFGRSSGLSRGSSVGGRLGRWSGVLRLCRLGLLGCGFGLPLLALF